MSRGARAADPSAYRLVVDVPVRFRDTDGMGHVNNAVFLTYLEVARERYWRELFELSDYRQVDLIVARIEIDYVSPTTVGETISVGIRVSAIGRRSFDFEYEGWERESRRMVVSARSVQAMYDYEARRSKEVSAQMKEKVLSFEAPGSVTLR